VALAAVNVGVIGEDISHGLRSQVIGEHERHVGCAEAQLQFDIIGEALYLVEKEKMWRVEQ
jgi:hypothetical protein